MKHLNVVAAVIKKGEEFLCVQRGETRYEYTSFKWEFPGGKVENGETEEQALVREIREEMNYNIEVCNHIITVDYQYPDFSISLSAYLCKPLQDNFNLNEHIAFKWLHKNDLNSLDWAAADLRIIERIAK